MRVQEASRRYAKALFTLTTENKSTERVLNELRTFNESVEEDADLKLFFTGPVTKAEELNNVLAQCFKKKKFSDELKGLLSILVSKRRLGLLPEISAAYQEAADSSQNVARGTVRSATTLGADDRTRLETTIARYAGKKAVLEYTEEKSLLGGLVAQVGSLTFDASLETQLRLMREELRRRRSN